MTEHRAEPAGVAPTAAAEPMSRSARRLRPEKREAVERAARGVFGRLGYERSSIDLISAEAAVSTRTVYKHFGSKMQLFSAVLVGGAAEVRRAFMEELEAVPTDGDARTQVTGLARATLAHRVRFPEHFAVVARATAEADLLPPDLIQAWLDAGPTPVRAATIARLGQLATGGALTVADAAEAARHLVALLMSTMSTEPGGGRPPTEEQLRAAVEVFLHGYSRPTV